MATSFALLSVLAVVLLLLIPVTTIAEEKLPPVELPYTCRVQSFRIPANDEVSSVPVGQSQYRDHTCTCCAGRIVPPYTRVTVDFVEVTPRDHCQYRRRIIC